MPKDEELDINPPASSLAIYIDEELDSSSDVRANLIRYFEKLMSRDKPVLNTCNNNDLSSSGDYILSQWFLNLLPNQPISPGLGWQKI